MESAALSGEAVTESKRIVITGGPRTGKTTLALSDAYSCPVRHTDDVAHLPWSDQSDAVSYWFDSPGPWVIEGVAAVRALRKWLERNHRGKPCDVVVFLTRSRKRLKVGQASMSEGVRGVWEEIRMVLVHRGVKIDVK